ncbi:MBL fold metallo-hydrolase [Bacillus sp. 2205SS5-2]|uniref:MBL fold metallo-hydrolase n=1 Tax=Bacillus sp. 2205SS5-2 TaxID=3109031 RepID=UPI003006986D
MSIQIFPVMIRSVGVKMKICTFLVDNLLIDTGPISARKKLIPIFKEHSIEKVILTHHHEDHTGNAKWIQDHLQKPIYIHPNGKELCEKKTSLPIYRAFFWGNRPSFSPFELPNVIHSENYSFQVVHTPGHADDHICLVDEEKQICFTGDLYLHHSPLSMFKFESIPQIMASLNELLKYSFKDIYCSHRGELKNGRKDLIRKLHYLEELSYNIASQYKAGYSVSEIRGNLFPKNTLFQYVSLFENSPTHIVHSVLTQSLSHEKTC